MDKLEGLECSERAKNIINRKISFFYIEAIPKFFSQLRLKIFFRARQKYFPDFLRIWGFGKGFLIRSFVLYKGSYKETLTKTQNSKKIEPREKEFLESELKGGF